MFHGLPAVRFSTRIFWISHEAEALVIVRAKAISPDRGRPAHIGELNHRDGPALSRGSKWPGLPFLFRGHAGVVESNPAHLDKLSSWSLFRVEHSSSNSEIRRLYEELVEYIDNEVMGQSAYSALWQKARGFPK